MSTPETYHMIFYETLAVLRIRCYATIPLQACVACESLVDENSAGDDDGQEEGDGVRVEVVDCSVSSLWIISGIRNTRKKHYSQAFGTLVRKFIRRHSEHS